MIHFYEKRDRPGLTHCVGSLRGIRITGETPGGGETGGDEPVAGLTVNHNGDGLVTLTIPGCTVSYADGTVTIAGLTEAVSYADGIVTIGG